MKMSYCLSHWGKAPSLLIFLLFSAELFSAGETGGAPGWWLSKLSGDASYAAMGSAGSALGGRGAGIYLNPAAVCRLKKDELCTFYRPLLDGGNYFFAGAAHKFGPAFSLPRESFAAISVAGYESGLAEKTTLLRESAGSFQERKQAVIFSFAYPAGNILDIGLNAKFLTRSMAGYRSSSAGADMGLIAHLRRADFSAVVQNIVPAEFKLKDSSEKYPRNLIFGLSAGFFSGRLVPAADIIIEEYGGKNYLWKTGFSFEVSPFLDLRAGINYREITAGFGVRTDPFSFDYALIMHTLDTEHLLSVNFYFDTAGGEEAKFYYESRKKVDEELSSLQDTKRLYDNLVNSAIEYFLNGQYQLARNEFKKAAALNPADSKEREMLFEVEIKINEKIREEKVGELLASARKNIGKSKFKECLEDVGRVLEIDPVNKHALSIQNQCYAYRAINDGEYGIAEGFLEDVMKIEPGNVKISTLLRRLKAFINYKETEGGKK
ncbi:MAG: hypothetical protein ABIJ15_07590 [bacterium]